MKTENKVYFEEDNNYSMIPTEPVPDVDDYENNSKSKYTTICQTVEIYPDGRCYFCFNDEKANFEYDRSKGCVKVHFPPADGYNFPNGFSSELRKTFFEGNRELLQTIVDQMNREPDFFYWVENLYNIENRELMDTADKNLKDYKRLSGYSLNYPEGKWKDKFDFPEHHCGVTPDELRELFKKYKYKHTDEQLNMIMNYMDADIERGCVSSFCITPDKKAVVVELPGCYFENPLYFFSKSHYRRGVYTPGEFLDIITEFEPSKNDFDFDNFLSAANLENPEGRSPAYNANMLCGSLNIPYVQDFSIPKMASRFLGALSYTPAFYDILKEFPQSAFAWTDNGRPEKLGDVHSVTLIPVEDDPYWNSEKAKKDVMDLAKLLDQYSPEGYKFQFSELSRCYPGFYPEHYKDDWELYKSDIGRNCYSLYKDVHLNIHPLFNEQGEGETDKEGHVVIRVPKIQTADRKYFTGIEYMMALPECLKADPAKGNCKRDYFIQVQSEYSSAFIENAMYLTIVEGKEGDKTENSQLYSTISLPPEKEVKAVVTAYSDDPVDYLARCQLASRTGRKLVTTKEVMEGARKKFEERLASVLGQTKIFEIFDMNKEINQKEIEIAEQMTKAVKSREKSSANSIER